MEKQVNIVVEEHPDGYVAYTMGLKSRSESVADIESKLPEPPHCPRPSVHECAHKLAGVAF